MGGLLVNSEGLRGAFLTAGLLQIAVVAALGHRLLIHIRNLDSSAIDLTEHGDTSSTVIGTGLASTDAVEAAS